MTDCTITLSREESTAMIIALYEYMVREPGFKFPSRKRSNEIKDIFLEDFNQLDQSERSSLFLSCWEQLMYSIEDFDKLNRAERLGIFLNCWEQLKRGTHQAKLDATLEEMGHEDKESKK